VCVCVCVCVCVWCVCVCVGKKGAVCGKVETFRSDILRTKRHWWRGRDVCHTNYTQKCNSMLPVQSYMREWKAGET